MNSSKRSAVVLVTARTLLRTEHLSPDLTALDDRTDLLKLVAHAGGMEFAEGWRDAARDVLADALQVALFLKEEAAAQEEVPLLKRAG